MKVFNPVVTSAAFAAFAVVFAAVPAAAQPVRPKPRIDTTSVTTTSDVSTTGVGKIVDAPPEARSELFATPKGNQSVMMDASSQNTPDPNLLFLLDMPDAETQPELFSSYLVETSARAEILASPALSRMILITLAQLESDPANAREIRRLHVRRMGNYFYQRAEIAAKSVNPDTGEKKTPDLPAALVAVQIAVRCNPEHVRARTLLAALLDGLRQTEGALDCLARGQHLVKNDDPDSRAYYTLFLNLLEKTERDEAVLQQTKRLLGLQPAAAAALGQVEFRRHLVQKAATAAINLGRPADAIALFRDTPPESLAAYLTESAALFSTGDTTAAIHRLYDAAPRLRGSDRNTLLQQIAIRHSEVGQWRQALAVSGQRTREFPDSIEARVQHYWLLLKNGKSADAAREAETLLARYPDNLGMLLSIANIARSNGDFAFVERCQRTHAQSASVLAETAANPTATKVPTLFDYLYAETLVRARRPREAIEHIRARGLDQEAQIRRNSNALPLLAAACFLLKDTETARRNIESYLIETPDEATRARILELQNSLFPAPNPDGTRPVETRSPEALRAVHSEIQRLSSRPRKLGPENYIPVGRLLTSCGDNLDALRILEHGALTFPKNGQLLAEYIAARIATNAIAASGKRTPLCKDIEKLLSLRRPDPRVWTPIAQWLASPDAAKDPAAAKLLPRVAQLVRRDLAPVD